MFDNRAQSTDPRAQSSEGSIPVMCSCPVLWCRLQMWLHSWGLVQCSCDSATFLWIGSLFPVTSLHSCGFHVSCDSATFLGTGFHVHVTATFLMYGHLQRMQSFVKQYLFSSIWGVFKGCYIYIYTVVLQCAIYCCAIPWIDWLCILLCGILWDMLSVWWRISHSSPYPSCVCCVCVFLPHISHIYCWFYAFLMFWWKNIYVCVHLSPFPTRTSLRHSKYYNVIILKVSTTISTYRSHTSPNFLLFIRYITVSKDSIY